MQPYTVRHCWTSDSLYNLPVPTPQQSMGRAPIVPGTFKTTNRDWWSPGQGHTVMAKRVGCSEDNTWDQTQLWDLTHAPKRASFYLNGWSTKGSWGGGVGGGPT